MTKNTMIVDALTGQIVERDMTPEELAQLEDVPTTSNNQSPVIAQETEPE